LAATQKQVSYFVTVDYEHLLKFMAPFLTWNEIFCCCSLESTNARLGY